MVRPVDWAGLLLHLLLPDITRYWVLDITVDWTMMLKIAVNFGTEKCNRKATYLSFTSYNVEMNCLKHPLISVE